jgi:hypothetical protein
MSSLLLVSDSIVLAIGGVAVLAIGFLLAQTGNSLLPQLLLPAIVIATIALSLPRLR